MAHQRHASDNDDDDFDDNSAYDDIDYNDSAYGYGNEDEDEPTRPCPYCRRPIHEEAERCPSCEQYISAEDAPAERKPWWLWLGIGLCLYAVLQWFF